MFRHCRCILSSAAATTRPPRGGIFPLKQEQIVSYRQKGYLVLDDFFAPPLFDAYKSAVSNAVERRGPKLVFPNADGNVQDLEIHVQGRVENPAAGPPGTNNSNKQQKQEEKGTVSGPTGTVPKTQFNIYAKNEKQAKRMGRKTQAKIKKARGDQMMNPQQAEENMTTEQVQQLHDDYVRSDSFQREVVQKMRIRDIVRFFEMTHRPWIHLWHGDDELRNFFVSSASSSSSGSSSFSPSFTDGGSSNNNSDLSQVGRSLGRLACEASGSARIRVFTDRAQYRCAWGNSHALHCEQPFVDFNDYRGTIAVSILGDTTLDRDSGGIVVMDGSHHVMRKITANSTDASVYKAAPIAWDFGELCRKFRREFKRCTPTYVTLKPNSVLLLSTQVVWGHVPNYTNDEAFMHAVTMMPDGSLYNNFKHTWLSRDAEGPLHDYEEGEPLNDDVLFPLLYSAVDDL